VGDSDLNDLLAALKAGEVTDTVRSSLEWILQQLIEAEATAVIGAGPHERTDSRVNQRNGRRPRLWSTPAGDVELEIPKLRQGSFFPSLLERRRRIDRALYAVVVAPLCVKGRRRVGVRGLARGCGRRRRRAGV
jgi:putative transposase